ncbi:hypothetical protein DM02DRAFT_672188 [Periconia macrospinosa]|uniref:NACHT domain-containing protein n=1 Tax=Periconia macrospinosa TaxID=97972 RepID=A0A2V1DPX7_9PLEO|nr:hypothetical protein DM02DRAFT_672188 [Periconia macrospinosa]
MSLSRHLSHPKKHESGVGDELGCSKRVEDAGDHEEQSEFDFQQWRNDQQSRLLWIKGDPGKGKTMLVCGIVNELKKSIAKSDLLSYFFCEAADSRINSATAVLRGLIYFLVQQDPSLTLHVQKMDLRLCLELNEKSISAAVASFIESKVDTLAHLNTYNSDTRDAVQRYLSLNADGTFLWVALVCQQISKTPGWMVQRKLKEFPPGLDGLYRRMMDQISDSEDAELCTGILAAISVVYRPLTLDELVSVVDLPPGIAGEYEALSEIIGLCGSFLTLRGRTISFVHQSAKDFLVEKAYDKTFPSGIEHAHRTVFLRLLQVMSDILKRDDYGLDAPGFPIDQVKQPDPDPLSAARYSCIYWVDHLLECDPAENATNDIHDGRVVDDFLRRKYLYWLEALSLCRSMSKGVVLIAKLEALLQGITGEFSLLKLVKDARRFIMTHRPAIETSPLQVYMSALVFSPARSLIRSLFSHEGPKWISIQPSMPAEWSACLQTLEGHSDSVSSVAFSPNSARLASTSYDKTVKIWDTSSGICLQTLVHSDWVFFVTFSPCGARVASASWHGIIKIWDVRSGACLQTLDFKKQLHKISFDATGSFIQTDIGAIAISALSASPISTIVTESPYPHCEGWGLSSEGTWITYNSENFLWLPSEYRPAC